MGSLLKVIRAKCIDCSGGSAAEVRECPVTRCALHPYRMGTNPHRAKRTLTDAQRAAMADRLRVAREAKRRPDAPEPCN